MKAGGGLLHSNGIGKNVKLLTLVAKLGFIRLQNRQSDQMRPSIAGVTGGKNIGNDASERRGACVHSGSVE